MLTLVVYTFSGTGTTITIATPKTVFYFLTPRPITRVMMRCGCEFGCLLGQQMAMKSRHIAENACPRIIPRLLLSLPAQLIKTIWIPPGSGKIYYDSSEDPCATGYTQ